MPLRIALVAYLVRDYDEAIHFFTTVLPFAKTEDSALGEGKRWVVVTPVNGNSAALLLAKADGAEQEAHIGHQTGGGSSCFCTPTISGATTGTSRRAA